MEYLIKYLIDKLINKRNQEIENIKNYKKRGIKFNPYYIW
jgi:hypothetical protein